ncbi:hypothetical protein RKD35_000193 [Streptomyces albogriseolus]
MTLAPALSLSKALLIVSEGGGRSVVVEPLKDPREVTTIERHQK